MFLTLQTVLDTKTGHVGCAVDEVTLNSVFSEYFSLPYGCHPTNAAYSLVHRILALCNISNKQRH